MVDFEEITILIRTGHEVDGPEVCRGCDMFYTIYSDGLVTYTACCESDSLDPRRDREHLQKVVEILRKAIRMIEDNYGLAKDQEYSRDYRDHSTD